MKKFSKDSALISVVIMTYKRSDTLGRAINSVLNQTYSNVEVIVVDDNNENDEYRLATSQLMSRYVPNRSIKYIKHRINKNGAAARNTGIAAATGEYITFLDDDDFFLPERLKQIVKEFGNFSNTDCIYSGVAFMRNRMISAYRYPIQHNDYALELLRQIQDPFFGTGSNIVCRTSVVRILNGFDDSFVRHQDMEFMIRLVSKFKLRAINDILVVKVTDSTLNVPNFQSLLLVKRHFLEKFSAIVKNYPKDIRNSIYVANYRQLASLTAKDNKNNRQQAIFQLKKYESINMLFKLHLLTKRYLHNDATIWVRGLIKATVVIINVNNWKLNKLIYRTLLDIEK